MKLFTKFFIPLTLSIIYDHITLISIVEGKRPNILFLIIDDLRPYLRCYGDTVSRTPEIDKIAHSGMIFTKAFAQQALCGPSRTSFLTSRRPDSTQVVDVHYYWRHHAGNYTSLPQYFKENGFHTLSAGKVFHPGILSNHNDDLPYSWSQVPYHPSTQKYKNAAVCSSNDGKLHSNIYCPVQVDDQPERTLPDIQIAKYAIRWLRKRYRLIKEYYKRNSFINRTEHDVVKPFFFAIGFHKPHIPLKFPSKFLDLYPINKIPLAPNRHLPVGLPLVSWNPWNDMRRRIDIKKLHVPFPFGPIPDNYSRYIKQGYYAATTYIDSLIGLITSEIRTLFPDTIIALIGDHGWSLGEHQEWSKYSNYEVSLKVPFIISLSKHAMKGCNINLPRISLHNLSIVEYFSKYINQIKNSIKFKESPKKILLPKSYDGIVELVDLFPTLVDLAGLPKIQSCPPNQTKILLCTEGISLACIIHSLINQDNLYCSKKMVAISQYPRPSVTPTKNPDSDQCRLNETNIMGYSIRDDRFRYTTWRAFNYPNFTVDWKISHGEELYDHKHDEGENINIIGSFPRVVKLLKKYLTYILRLR